MNRDPRSVSTGDEVEFVEFDVARAMMLERVRPLDPADRPLVQARGCQLAVDVLAPIPLPPFDNAAMDGYAVRLGPGSGWAR